MTGLTPNTDFLSNPSQKDSHTLNPIHTKQSNNVTPITNANRNKEKPKLEVKMVGFDEYYALNDYSRKVLCNTNYWKVMWGLPIIDVPSSDTEYYKYFDKRCYDRCELFQKNKKAEREEYEAKRIADQKAKELKFALEQSDRKVKEEIEAKQILIKQNINKSEEKAIEHKIEPIKPIELKPVQKPIAIEVKVNNSTKVKPKKETKDNDSQPSLF